MKKVILILIMLGSFTIASTQTEKEYNPYKHQREEFIKEGEFFIESFKKINCNENKEFIQNAFKGYYSGEYIGKNFRLISNSLGKMYCPEIIDFFEYVITIDSSEEVRCEAIQKLGWLRADSKISFLINHAKNNISEQERITIALSLCVMAAYEEAIRIADIFCYDNEGYVREECIAIYEFAGEKKAALTHYQRFFTNLKDERYLLFAAQKLAEYGDSERAYPIFIEFLNSSDSEKVIGALRGLAMIGDERSFQIIREKTQSKNQVVAQEAQIILNKIEQGRRGE